jgi:hypothetical protein
MENSNTDISTPNQTSVLLNKNPDLSNGSQASSQTDQSPALKSNPKNSGRNASKRKTALLVFALLIFLFFTGSLSFIWALTYEKIALNNFKDLQDRLSFSVQSLPFMPKTAKFVITKSAIAHSEIVDSHSFEILVSVDPGSLLAVTFNPTLTSIDMSFTGSVDTNQPGSPNLELNTKITKDIDFDLKAIDKNVFIRFNTLDGFAAEYGDFFGFTDDTRNKWILFEDGGSETQSLQTVDEESLRKPLTKDLADKTVKILEDNYIKERLILRKELMDGKEYFVINLNADKEAIKRILTVLNNDKEPSGESLDMIKELNLEIFVDKSTFLINKASSFLAISLKTDKISPFFSLLETASFLEIKVTVLAKLNNYNEAVDITLPKDFIPSTSLPKNFSFSDSIIEEEFWENKL